MISRASLVFFERFQMADLSASSVFDLVSLGPQESRLPLASPKIKK